MPPALRDYFHVSCNMSIKRLGPKVVHAFIGELKMNRLLAAAAILLVLPVSFAHSESPGSRRGLVTTANCPYTCAEAGLSSQNCVERKVGNKCQIEDFTQPAGHRSMARVNREEARSSNVNSRAKQTTLMVEPGRRGLITSTNCPYTCKDAGLQKNVCQESRVGNTCRIEDFTQPPGHRTLVRLAEDR